MVDAALGTTDAVEWANAGRAGFHPWYATLNNGLTATAVGGEDSISNLQRSKLVGSVRTYVYTGGKGLTMEAWLAGLRNGNAFVSTGPLVELTVNGRIPGEEVELASSGTVELQGRVRSITPLDKAFVIFNGEVVEEIPFTGERRELDLSRSYPVSGSGWFHLRVEGRNEERFPLDANFALGFTNPVWVTVAGQPVRNRASAEYSIRWIDKLRAMAEEWPGWRSEQERAHVFAQFDEARRIYEGFLAEASGAGGSN